MMVARFFVSLLSCDSCFVTLIVFLYALDKCWILLALLFQEYFSLSFCVQIFALKS